MTTAPTPRADHALTDEDLAALVEAIYRGRIRNCEQTVKDWPGEDASPLLVRVLRGETERFVADAADAVTAIAARHHAAGREEGLRAALTAHAGDEVAAVVACVLVPHADMEERARFTNEGYDLAVAQGVFEDVERAEELMQERVDAAVRLVTEERDATNERCEFLRKQAEANAQTIGRLKADLHAALTAAPPDGGHDDSSEVEAVAAVLAAHDWRWDIRNSRTGDGVRIACTDPACHWTAERDPDASHYSPDVWDLHRAHVAAAIVAAKAVRDDG